MKIHPINELNEDQKKEILRIWNAEYPVTLELKSTSDLESYFSGLSNKRHSLLINNSGEINGWSVVFERENETWFVIILKGKIQGKGYGKLVLNDLKQKNGVLNGWVIDNNQYKKENGEVYRSPLLFYLKNGFIVNSSVRLELDTISAARIEWKKQ